MKSDGWTWDTGAQVSFLSVNVKYETLSCMSDKHYLKINCLQLKWSWVNLLNMRTTASWAHHSLPVDFDKHNSRPPNMCTSSIVQESSQLPFFMSRHVDHLTVFSSFIQPLILCFYAYQLRLVWRHMQVSNSEAKLTKWLIWMVEEL